MRHPFEILELTTRRRLYWLFLVATVAIAAVLQYFGGQFASKRSPTGEQYDIVAFELAHTPGRAGQIMETWGPEGVEAAVYQTWVDFLFPFAYANLLALGILALMSARGDGGFLAGLGRALAYGQWVAGALDVVENVALLRVLSGAVYSGWTALAYYCALFKFGIIALALLYLLIMLPYASRKTSPSAAIGMDA